MAATARSAAAEPSASSAPDAAAMAQRNADSVWERSWNDSAAPKIVGNKTDHTTSDTHMSRVFATSTRGSFFRSFVAVSARPLQLFAAATTITQEQNRAASTRWSADEKEKRPDAENA